MDQIVIRGVAPSGPQDDRTLLIIDIHHEGETFEWEARVPPSYGLAFGDYIEDSRDRIVADLAAKLAEWEVMDPKTRTVDLGDDMGTAVVPVHRSEIVRPTYPDYYALRAREYPDLKEQLDAVFKGGNALEEMRQVISEIKSRHPKP